jgi:tetratricopeptide (TPR) repeat protein
MTRACRVVTAFLTVSLMAVVLAPRDAAAAPAPDEELNDKGVELRRRGDDRGALAAFQKAYDMTHSPRATAQLGLVHQALGRWELAGPLVEKALQSPNDPWVKKYLTQLQDALTTIRQHLARIELTGEPEGAQVIVNGVPAGKLPLPAPLTVSTGTVDLQVRADGYQPDIRKVTVAPYQYEHIFVRLDKLPEAKPIAVDRPPIDEGHPPPPPPPPPPKDTNPSLSPRTIIKWSALGLGAAGVVTGVVATILHESAINKFNTAANGSCQDRNGTAYDSTNKMNSECQSALDSAHSDQTWQIVGFVAGGAFAATWLVLQLTEPDSGSAGSTTSWNCAPSLTSPGASCGVRF